MKILLSLWNLNKISNILKKHEPDSLNILEIIDSEKHGYARAEKVLFQNTIRH